MLRYFNISKLTHFLIPIHKLISSMCVLCYQCIMVMSVKSANQSLPFSFYKEIYLRFRINCDSDVIYAINAVIKFKHV